MINWPGGYALSRHDELDSTSSEARRLAESGEQGPLWIMADRQTAGRGRRGRVWQTLSGNLAATLLLRPLNVDTLATAIYQFASRGSFEDGALAALLIVAASIGPVAWLTRFSDMPSGPA